MGSANLSAKNWSKGRTSGRDSDQAGRIEAASHALAHRVSRSIRTPSSSPNRETSGKMSWSLAIQSVMITRPVRMLSVATVRWWFARRGTSLSERSAR